MTVINGGKLTKKIQFFQSTNASDGAGGIQLGEPDSLILETWSSIKQIKASRVAENFQEGLNAVYEIKLRQRTGFEPQINYTLKWDNKICEIVEISEDIEQEKQWVIIAINRGKGLQN